MSWIIGLIMFEVTLLFLFAYTLTALFVGDQGTVQRIAGAMSVEEEIEEETHGISELQRGGA